MHQPLLWLLTGLAVCVLAGWRIGVSRRRAAEMRAARETAMAIALAEAHQAAQEALALKNARHAAATIVQRQVQARTAAATAAPAVAAPPAVTAKHVAPPASTPDADSQAAQAQAQAARAAAHAKADLVIAAEAARRQSAQKVARVEADRRETISAKAAAPAVPVAPVAPIVPVQAAAPVVAPPAVAAAPAAAERPVEPQAAELKTAAQTVILLADDSKMVRAKTGRLLSGHQFQVFTAVDGLDAVRQLETLRPDLVITDVDMPGMDGFGLARHLQENAETAGIPIVMITSAEERHREAAHRAGVGLVLGKPYVEDDLIAHIRSFRFAAVQGGVQVALPA